MPSDHFVSAVQLELTRRRRPETPAASRHVGLGESAACSDLLRALDSPTQSGETESHADQRDDADGNEGLTEWHPDGTPTNFQ